MKQNNELSCSKLLVHLKETNECSHLKWLKQFLYLSL